MHFISLGFSSRPAAITLFAMIAVLLVAVPIVAAWRTRLDEPGRADERRIKHARYARSLVVIWAITALALYALRLYGMGIADVGVRAPQATWEYGLGLVVPLIFGFANAGRVVVIPSDYLRRVRRVIPLDASDWVWFVPVALTAGICEEFLYRGYALTQIAALTGSIEAGMFLSSVAFGLAHMYQGRIGVVGTMLTGALYAVVFQLTGSVVPCMIGHISQDIIAGILYSRRIRAADSRASDAV
jgi:membrane protease YdiL (CAAX protease family)